MRTGRNDKRAADWRAKNAQRPQTAALMGYAEMKAHFTLLAANAARGAVTRTGRVPLILSHALVTFEWREIDRKRDPDGVRAASKFVLDGFVQAGILRTDGAALIGRFRDEFIYNVPSGVWVSVRDLADETEFSCTVPVRFPDLNEMLAARGRDGMLTERTRQARRGAR